PSSVFDQLLEQPERLLRKGDSCVLLEQKALGGHEPEITERVSLCFFSHLRRVRKTEELSELSEKTFSLPQAHSWDESAETVAIIAAGRGTSPLRKSDPATVGRTALGGVTKNEEQRVQD